MRSRDKAGAVVAAVLVGVLGLAVNATAANATGSVKGKVVKADGSAVAGAEVRLMARAPKPAKAAPNATGQAPQTRAEKRAARQASRQAGGEVREPVAHGTTDANGAFLLSDVPEGSYVVAARMKGIGNARRPVGIHAGNPADVTLTLKERSAASKPRKQGARKGKTEAKQINHVQPKPAQAKKKPAA